MVRGRFIRNGLDTVRYCSDLERFSFFLIIFFASIIISDGFGKRVLMGCLLLLCQFMLVSAMTADSSELCVGSEVEIQLAAGLGLPSAGDRQELIDANGIACLDGEEKIEGGSERSITLGNGNLEEPREQHLELDEVKGENGYGELVTENGDDYDGTADATLNIDVSEANGCDYTAPSSDVEEGVVKLELPETMAGEGIGDAIEQQLENEMLDEKKGDIKKWNL